MQQNIPKGILCILLSTLLLTSQDALTKWLLQSHNLAEVMFYKGALSVPWSLALHRLMGNSLGSLASARPGLTTLRTTIGVVCTVFVTLSVHYLPLAEALAVIFLSPVLLTALSAPMLNERVGWRRWLAVLAGFLGVLLITEPGQAPLSWTIALPLMAALSGALRDIYTRKLGGIDPPTTTLFWSMVASMVVGALAIPVLGLGWPAAAAWPLFLVASLLVVVAMWLIILAFQLASGSVIAPFRYLSLVWAGLIGFLVWGDVPSAMKIAGAAVVCGSGLYIWWRETRRVPV
ncbi:MAG: DMT family transporter [Gammaproteobacteria bacterium]|nr:DMT family transporter [Gammaproteobacteria bacterium]